PSAHWMSRFRARNQKLSSSNLASFAKYSGLRTLRATGGSSIKHTISLRVAGRCPQVRAVLPFGFKTALAGEARLHGALTLGAICRRLRLRWPTSSETGRLERNAILHRLRNTKSFCVP